jgi:predicted ArsR family transcriptional regulator
MKQKKETLASKALDLVKQNPNIKPKEMAEKLGVTVQRVYVLRNNLKKKLTKKVVSNVTTKRKGRPAKMERMLQVSRPANYYQNLEHENRKLTEWTLMWKQKYEKLEQDYTQAKVMYLNSQAVIDYLENKVANLITISNLKGN